MIAISDRVETIAHVIQIALTPVFLFSGIATLLNVLSTRLGRVADRVDSVSERLERAEPRERGGSSIACTFCAGEASCSTPPSSWRRSPA